MKETLEFLSQIWPDVRNMAYLFIIVWGIALSFNTIAIANATRSRR